MIFITHPGLGSRGEDLDSGEAFDAVLLREIGTHSGIHHTQFDSAALQLCRGFLPVRGEVLAVTAPGSVELYHPMREVEVM